TLPRRHWPSPPKKADAAWDGWADESNWRLCPAEAGLFRAPPPDVFRSPRRGRAPFEAYVSWCPIILAPAASNAVVFGQTRPSNSESRPRLQDRLARHHFFLFASLHCMYARYNEDRETQEGDSMSMYHASILRYDLYRWRPCFTDYP